MAKTSGCECLIKKPNTASNCRSSHFTSSHWDSPWPGWHPTEDAASQVPGLSMSNECHFLSLPGISRKPTAEPAHSTIQVPLDLGAQAPSVKLKLLQCCPTHPSAAQHHPALPNTAQHILTPPNTSQHCLICTGTGFAACVPAKPGNSPLQSGGYLGVC